MKLPKLNILNETSKVLRTKSVDVEFPLSKEEKKLIRDMMDYLKMSQIEETRVKYDLRPGMGLAFIQLGIPKRIFVVVHEIEEGKFEEYIVVNPKIKSQSEELIYVGEGEGCLSINRETVGIIPRYARMRIVGFDENGKEFEIRTREELSIVFQHELDHLDGILFIDRIDKKNPFKNKDMMREI